MHLVLSILAALILFKWLQTGFIWDFAAALVGIAVLIAGVLVAVAVFCTVGSGFITAAQADPDGAVRFVFVLAAALGILGFLLKKDGLLRAAPPPLSGKSSSGSGDTPAEAEERRQRIAQSLGRPLSNS